MELVEGDAAEDEETDGCLPGLELAGSEAAGGPRCTITLQQARIAALDVLNFCLDNQDHCGIRLRATLTQSGLDGFLRCSRA